MKTAAEWAERFDWQGDPRPFAEIIADIQRDALNAAANRCIAVADTYKPDGPTDIAIRRCVVAINALMPKGGSR